MNSENRKPKLDFKKLTELSDLARKNAKLLAFVKHVASLYDKNETYAENYLYDDAKDLLKELGFENE